MAHHRRLRLRPATVAVRPFSPSSRVHIHSIRPRCPRLDSAILDDELLAQGSHRFRARPRDPRHIDEQLAWIAREPANARPYCNLAQLYRMNGRQEEALGLCSSPSASTQTSPKRTPPSPRSTPSAAITMRHGSTQELAERKWRATSFGIAQPLSVAERFLHGPRERVS